MTFSSLSLAFFSLICKWPVQLDSRQTIGLSPVVPGCSPVRASHSFPFATAQICCSFRFCISPSLSLSHSFTLATWRNANVRQPLDTSRGHFIIKFACTAFVSIRGNCRGLRTLTQRRERLLVKLILIVSPRQWDQVAKRMQPAL